MSTWIWIVLAVIFSGLIVKFFDFVLAIVLGLLWLLGNLIDWLVEKLGKLLDRIKKLP